jgi:hypothetical protein
MRPDATTVTSGHGLNFQAFLQQAQVGQTAATGAAWLLAAVAMTAAAGAGVGAAGRFWYCGLGPAERKAAVAARRPATRSRREVFMVD